MESVSKVQLAPNADQLLEEMRSATNEGFRDGRVTKSQLASWIIADFYGKRFKASVAKIRSDHFDEIAHLRSKLKEMEERKKKGKLETTKSSDPATEVSNDLNLNEQMP